MKNSRTRGVFLAILCAIGLASCGGSNSTQPVGQQQSASIFTVGTDASLPSVVSCEVTVTGVTVFNGTTNVSVLNAPQVVDFAALSGLHQLLDLSSVPPGTYTSATITLANPTIGYIDTTQNPPAITVISGTLTQTSATSTFSSPFVLNDGDLVGLRIHFDLYQSLQTDVNKQITGVVNPTVDMALLGADDAKVSIDDFHGGVVGVTGPNSFTIQGPKGRQWDVQVNDSTTLDDPNIPISSFTTNTIVEVTGQLDPVTHAIDANEVEVLSMDGFYLGGLFTSIRPPSGPATEADLFVRAELPAINGISDGQIFTLDLNGSEKYRIAHADPLITALLFNNSALAAGQRVGVGGQLTMTNGVPNLTVHRVVLRRQGQQGTWVPGSTIMNGNNNGSFSFTDNWTDGVLLPSPLTVITTDNTNFVNLSGLSALSGNNPIPLRVVGIVLVNPSTGQPVFVARRVEELTAE
ncbi:MAG TPA: hypothetical protein VJR23_04130 [Candidatus Acidoferrales bacterium]|nr:hypothetical protein [Candidatus Acidoferrales bacterium]